MEMYEGYGGGLYSPRQQHATPRFLYEKHPYTLRRHWLRTEWIRNDGTTFLYGVNQSDPFWDSVDAFCEENFSLFGNGILHICYHVNRKDGVIEFLKKADAMLFKLGFQ